MSVRASQAASLGPTNRICVLENHGPLTAGSTIEEAFFYMATLTRACEYQVCQYPAGVLVHGARERFAFSSPLDRVARVL